jgi:hypothetical protein
MVFQASSTNCHSGAQFIIFTHPLTEYQSRQAALAEKDRTLNIHKEKNTNLSQGVRNLVRVCYPQANVHRINHSGNEKKQAHPKSNLPYFS